MIQQTTTLPFRAASKVVRAQRCSRGLTPGKRAVLALHEPAAKQLKQSPVTPKTKVSPLSGWLPCDLPWHILIVVRVASLCRSSSA